MNLEQLSKECAKLIRDGDPELMKANIIKHYLQVAYCEGALKSTAEAIQIGGFDMRQAV